MSIFAFHFSSQSLIVNANQITGYIDLEAPKPGVIRRYLKLEWECPGVDVKVGIFILTKLLQK